jgi:UDP-glucose 4-epimerase
VYEIDDRPHTETSPTVPVDIYGQTKLMGESLLQYLATMRSDLSVSSMRFSNVYGPGETNPHVVPDIIERLRSDREATIHMGYLGAVRDFIHVADLAAAIQALVRRHGTGHEAFNVSTGQGTSIRDLVTTIKSIVEDDRPVEEQAALLREFERKELVLDPGKLKAATGWSSQVSLEEGLAELIRLEF